MTAQHREELVYNERLFLEFENGRLINQREIDNNDQRLWFKFEDNDIALKSGIYVFACAGDNHILFEVHRLEKGKNFGNILKVILSIIIDMGGSHARGLSLFN